MSTAERLTDEHDLVLAALAVLSPDVDADAALVAALIRWPESVVARLLADLEAAGCVASATGPPQ